MDKYFYTMLECDVYCGLVFVGKSWIGYSVVKLGFVGEENLEER